MNSRKAELLYNEVLKDIEVGNYNKAASALYFSIRKELEEIITKKMKLSIPRRDDKLANILKHLGFEEEAEMFMELYNLRKKADYSDESIDKDELIKAIEKYKNILLVISKLK